MKTLSIILGSLVLLLFSAGIASEMSPAQKAKVTALLDSMSVLGKDPVIVAAVKKQNAELPAILQGLDNAKWKDLGSESPEVTSLAKNELAHYLRGKVHHTVIELFISDAEGRKVVFFTKTTSFIHKGKAKHDQPMQGKKWLGDLELDESTKQMQIQGSFPVLDNGKPIGSVVLGFWVPKL